MKKDQKKEKEKSGIKSTKIIKHGQDVSLSSFDPDIFEEALKNEKIKKELLEKYIKDQLREGIDYGKIKIEGKDGKSHLSKPTLFKAGSEKFNNLLKLKALFFPDEEVRKMLPENVLAQGVIILICRLVPISRLDNYFTKEELKKLLKEKSDQFENVIRILQVTEGRGACTLAEKKGMINNAIKITEKRATTDATLRLGLSDTFTQDLEDMPNGNSVEKKEPVASDVITFGKHKGKKWNEVPVDYLNWLKGEGKYEFPDALQKIIDDKKKPEQPPVEVKAEVVKDEPKKSDTVRQEIVKLIWSLCREIGCKNAGEARELCGVPFDTDNTITIERLYELKSELEARKKNDADLEAKKAKLLKEEKENN